MTQIHIPIVTTCDWTCRPCIQDCDLVTKGYMVDVETIPWNELNQAQESGTHVHLMLNGGDPFVHPELDKLCSKIHKKTTFTILTNGSEIQRQLLTVGEHGFKEWIKWLKQYRARCTVSVYAPIDHLNQHRCYISLLRKAGITANEYKTANWWFDSLYVENDKYKPAYPNSGLKPVCCPWREAAGVWYNEGWWLCKRIPLVKELLNQYPERFDGDWAAWQEAESFNALLELQKNKQKHTQCCSSCYNYHSVDLHLRGGYLLTGCVSCALKPYVNNFTVGDY